MASICFVTNEIYPVTPGGAGSLIFHLTRALLSEQQSVILLLNVSKAALDRFQQSELELFPNSKNCRIYHLDELCRAAPFKESDFQSRFGWESARYDYACRQVYEREKPDRIEFVDYNGPAYAALCAKIAGLSYQTAHMVIRMHGPVELIDRYAMSKPLDFDRYTSYALERASFRLAETVLYPTPSFLTAYYSDISPTWMGKAVCSPPVLTVRPTLSSPAADANIVLFFGRLFAVKGVDRFIEAALQSLAMQPGSQLKFYLVGYDSMEPPDLKSESYTAYCWQKIPPEYRGHFTIPGHLNWQQLDQLLPKVKFAVIPSYFESFSFAAHELQRMGIPLIVSDIPAFRDSFKPEEEVVFFDGSVQDLANQIIRLNQDADLRKKLSGARVRPQTSQASWYLSPVDPGWISPTLAAPDLELSIWIIDNDRTAGSAARTLLSISQTLKTSQAEIQHIWILKRCEGENVTAATTWLFGEHYEIIDEDGNPVEPGEPRSTDALLILQAGDEVSPEYIPRCLGILAHHPQIAFVGSWKTIRRGDREWLQTHPFAVMLELAPLEIDSLFSRNVMRTPAGLALTDLFDRHARGLGEVAYLWCLDQGQTCGIQIPEMLVTQDAEYPPLVDESARAYLLMQAGRCLRSDSLSRYLAMLTAGFLQSWLPLQTAWAGKGGLKSTDVNQLPQGTKSIFPQDTWRRRVVRRLSMGGVISQQLLKWLNWIWFRLKARR